MYFKAKILSIVVVYVIYKDFALGFDRSYYRELTSGKELILFLPDLT